MSEDYKSIWRKILRIKGTNQGSLAEVMGFSTGKMNKILTDEASLSVELFEEIKDTLSLETKESEILKSFIKEPISALEKEKEARRNLVIIAKYFDLSVLSKALNISNIKNSIIKLNEILEFFDIKDMDSFVAKIPNDIKETIGLARQFKVDILEPSASNLYIFRKECDKRINAIKSKIPAYSRDKLLKLITKAHTYTKDIDNGLINFVTELKKCGIIVVEQAHLPKTYLNGLSYYNGANPIVVLTYRLKKLDNLFFALCHELGHCVLHLDYLKDHKIIMHENGLKSAIEDQAEDFARETLKVNEILLKAIFIKRSKGVLNDQDIRDLAKELDIGEGIIVGSLQFSRIIPYSKFNNFKTEAPHLPQGGNMT